MDLRFFRIALLIAAAGCAYDVDVESMYTQLVLEPAGCPAADTIARARRAESADLVDARVQRRGPLCWYRVEHDGVDPPCTGEDAPRAPITLDDRRDTERRIYEEEERGGYGLRSTDRKPQVMCTIDGPVLLVIGDLEGCKSLDGEAAGDVAASESRTDLVVGELLASDDRAALVACTYRVESEETRRPFSCGLPVPLGNM